VRSLAIGAHVTWRQILADGHSDRSGATVLDRMGIVVGQAPLLGAGHSDPVWVVPDAPLEGDLYLGGLVVARKQYEHGTPRCVAKGELFADLLPTTPTAIYPAFCAANATRSDRPTTPARPA
jgi:hypothetical protein